MNRLRFLALVLLIVGLTILIASFVNAAPAGCGEPLEWHR